MFNESAMISSNERSTDRALKIVHALAYYGDYSGGIQHYVKSLARQQAEDGHDVVIVTSSGYASDSSSDVARVIRAKTLFSAFRVPFTPTLPLILLREKFDVLHVHLPLPWLDLCAILIKILKGKILVITIHNDLQVTSLLSKILAFIHNHFSIRCAIECADAIITSTNAFADSLPYSIPANKHFVISPGIDRDVFKPLNLARRKEVLFVGRMIPEKGLHLLVEAFEQVRSRYPEYRLIVAYQDVYSYGNYYRKAIGQSSVYMVEENNCSHQKLVTLYNTCKCLVVPSLQESYSLTILEAIACGCPVVAFKLPGPYEAFSNANVRWVPLGDVGALARQIIECIEAECNVMQISELNGNSWSKISRRIESVYKVVLNNNSE